jgi:hypothetical protein
MIAAGRAGFHRDRPVNRRLFAWLPAAGRHQVVEPDTTTAGRGAWPSSPGPSPPFHALPRNCALFKPAQERGVAGDDGQGPDEAAVLGAEEHLELVLRVRHSPSTP